MLASFLNANLSLTLTDGVSIASGEVREEVAAVKGAGEVHVFFEAVIASATGGLWSAGRAPSCA